MYDLLWVYMIDLVKGCDVCPSASFSRDNVYYRQKMSIKLYENLYQHCLDPFYFSIVLWCMNP
jgi:hypothetical protein